MSAVDPGSGHDHDFGDGGGRNENDVPCTRRKDTVLRRYAPDSVQFDDAKPSSLEQIKAGDQLRARGARSADGSEFAAEEIVSGSFRNIAGTISNVDAATNAITVMDLVTKKPVVVKISTQSQLLKLPPQMAQGMAMQLKGGGRGGAGGNGAAGCGAPGGAAAHRRAKAPGMAGARDAVRRICNK